MTKAEYAREWRKNNPDKIREYQKKYREQNPEKVREYAKKYREENPEKHKENLKQWREKNPEKVKQYSIKKRLEAETDIDKFVDILYRGMVDRTRIRNKKGREHEMMDFDREFLKKKIARSNGVCSISGLPLSFKKGDPCVVSVDRKNNSKGYVKNNIQIVAAVINVARQDLTIKQFVALCKSVAKNNP
jgi:hypothetical protein